MACIVVFLSIACQQLFDLLDSRYMMSEGEKLTTLLCVVALTFAFYGLIFI
jgi:hypothetical protein